MVAGTYHAGLVVLSVLIAIVASYAAFDLGERVSASDGHRRWVWLASGAMAMGFAIWSMHYVGMLALILPVPVRYHVPTVALSLAAAVAGAALALHILSRKTMRRLDTAIAGLCLGGAIVSMHYIGMAAMITLLTAGCPSTHESATRAGHTLCRPATCFSASTTR